MNVRRIGAVRRASLRMFGRDRPAFFFTFAFPIMFMVLFGLIFGGGGTSRPTVDVAGTGPCGRRSSSSDAIKLKAQPDEAHALKRVATATSPRRVLVRRQRAPGLLGDLAGRGADRDRRRARHRRRLQPPGRARQAGRRLTLEPVEAQSLDYVDLLVPGLLAMAIAQSAAFGVAFSLVAWRQKGMLRRLRLTPLPLVEFATARIIFHLMIALVQAVILLTVGRLLFGVHLVGNVLALLPLILLGGIAFIALGMCIGGRVNSEDATAALSNLIVLPMTFLGGVFFPLSSAPAPVRVIAHFLPLTYLAEGLQNVAVRGHSFTSTLPNLGVLALVAPLLSGLALRLFRWQTT